MPNYNKQCKECGHKFEINRGYDEDHTKVRCPNCKSRKIKNLISVPAIVYGDEGFTQYNGQTEE